MEKDRQESFEYETTLLNRKKYIHDFFSAMSRCLELKGAIYVLIKGFEANKEIFSVNFYGNKFGKKSLGKYITSKKMIKGYLNILLNNISEKEIDNILKDASKKGIYLAIRNIDRIDEQSIINLVEEVYFGNNTHNKLSKFTTFDELSRMLPPGHKGNSSFYFDLILRATVDFAAEMSIEEIISLRNIEDLIMIINRKKMNS